MPQSEKPGMSERPKSVPSEVCNAAKRNTLYLVA